MRLAAYGMQAVDRLSMYLGCCESELSFTTDSFLLLWGYLLVFFQMS